MQSISRTREVKDSAELYERILEAEGMPAEFPDDKRVSFVALDDEVLAAGPEETDGGAAEDGALRTRAAALRPADQAVVERIKAAGWAATPEEVGAHPDQIGRLADAGIAYLRACGKRAALALLAGRGEIRKVRCRFSGTTLVVLAGVPWGSVARELRRVADLKAALVEERRESMKPHGSEVERVGGRQVAEWLVGFRRAVEGRRLKPGHVRELIRREFPFRVGLYDALGEDEEIEEWQRSHVSRREENARIIRRDLAAGIVPGPYGVSPEPHWTEDPALRRRVEAQLRTGRAACNTARAIYVSFLPTLAHKVLHLLRRDGRRPQERFVVLARAHDPGSSRPEELLEEAVRQLGEADKVRRMRSRKTGRIYLEATKGLDLPSYELDLGRIVRSQEYRILVPRRGRQRITPDKTRLASTAVPGESSA